MRDSVGSLFCFAGIALIIGAIFAPIIIDFGREHGHPGLSAIFTPGRFSTENVLGALIPTFSLFTSISLTVLFLVVKETPNQTEARNPVIFGLIGFFVLLVGFLSSVSFMFYSNMTGTATELFVLYILISMVLAGLSCVMFSLSYC